MSPPVITIENLGKKYRLTHQTEPHRYTTLRDTISKGAKGIFRARPAGERNGITRSEEFWALKDLSLEIKQGEVVGIIGRNGAGKSTLLKILSRITEPTTGRIRIRGRVASLLEVGTGFHPELTGRENIYLNGAILGMARGQIRRKFDEIVAFAEVERFLDTPVKHYSSGMYVRLAFAVAAHTEPDVLIIDEVLAVGDAEFQKKCLGKMNEVSQDGRTVLFVSHNIPTVNRLCQRCILLDSGKITMDDQVTSVTARYLVSDTGTMAQREWKEAARRPGDDVARLIGARVMQNHDVADTVDIRFPIEVQMTYEALKEGANLLSAFSFFDSQGTHLFVTGDLNDPQWSRPRPRGIYTSRCRVPGNVFAEGIVRVVAEVSTRYPAYAIHFLEFDSLGFQVVDKGQPGSVRGDWGRPIPGVMRLMCEWLTEEGATAASHSPSELSNSIP
jgi:lipopolysaccharide transport system ATP-binding protein